MTLICMKLKRFAFFIQKVIILSFLATRTKKEQSFTRPSSLKKEVAKQYHHTMADYSYYTWVVSSKVGASRGRNIKIGDLKHSGQTKVVLLPHDCFFYFEELPSLFQNLMTIFMRLLLRYTLQMLTDKRKTN